MINKITIQNFKSIKDKVEIDLKPITLLFGPNSAGKSTVVQAIHYMKEILDRNNTDPGKTELGGEAVDLGGFANLVNRKEGDPENNYKFVPIVLGFEIEEDDWLEPYYDGLLQNNGYDPYYIETTIEWDENLGKPIVKKYDVHINNEFIGRIEMDGWNVDDETENATGLQKLRYHSRLYGKQPKFKISKLNLNHPNLLWTANYDVSEEEEEPEQKLKDIIEEIPDNLIDIEEGKMGLFVYYNENAFPKNKPIKIYLSDLQRTPKEAGKDEEDSSEYEEHLKQINNTLSQIFCTPIHWMREVLKNFCYIGPIRTIPERNFNPERFPIEGRWSDGLGAWDLLYRKFKSDKESDKKLLKDVNKWMDELDTGYSIIVKEYKEIDLDNPIIMGIDEQGRMLDDGAEIRRSFEKIPTQIHLQLFEHKNRIYVSAKDIGSGIAQVLPIVVGTVDWERRLLTVEQPELHIHPAIQQKLADMLIPFTNDNRFIIFETHSEHIMLRLLRRIGETTENKLEKPEYALKPDDVSVVYVEPTDEGVKMTQLPIDETGEFTEKWPRGFFEERIEDIF